VICWEIGTTTQAGSIGSKDCRETASAQAPPRETDYFSRQQRAIRIVVLVGSRDFEILSRRSPLRWLIGVLRAAE
jgi:hypothetical protein